MQAPFGRTACYAAPLDSTASLDSGALFNESQCREESKLIGYGHALEQALHARVQPGYAGTRRTIAEAGICTAGKPRVVRPHGPSARGPFKL